MHYKCRLGFYEITVFISFYLGMMTLSCNSSLPDIATPPQIREINNTGHISEDIEKRSMQYGLVPLSTVSSDVFEIRIWSPIDETGIEKCLIYRRDPKGTITELITPVLKVGADHSALKKIPVSIQRLNVSQEVLLNLDRIVEKYGMLDTISTTEVAERASQLPVLDDPVITIEVMYLKKYLLFTSTASDNDPRSIEIENFCAEWSDLLQLDLGCRIR